MLQIFCQEDFGFKKDFGECPHPQNEKSGLPEIRAEISCASR
jgi:hypothetical protein